LNQDRAIMFSIKTGSGNSATRPLPSDGSAEEFRGDSTVWPRTKSGPEIKDG